jgi:hypothetical protein
VGALKIKPESALKHFRLEDTPSWVPPLQKSELLLLKDYLKKFMKYLASSPNKVNSISFDKLINITDNLCKTNRKRTDKDLSSLFVKSMFSDGLIENEMIKSTILIGSSPESIDDLFQVKISEKMLAVVQTLNQKISQAK